MSDDNPWRTFLARRANGMREVHTASVITDEQRQQGWERAVEHLEREMRRLKGEATSDAPSRSTLDPGPREPD